MDQQQGELAKVKARIRALASRTVERGCSEAEAMAAAAKVGELLDVYGLSMSEVELREEACMQRRLTFRGPHRPALRWLFPAILRFCDCRGWTDGRDDFVLFGLDPDVQMADYLLQVILGALGYEETRFRAGPDYVRSCQRQAPQSVLRSFRYGFAARVSERLDSMAEARRAAARPVATSSGTALVLVKQQMIEDGFRQLGVRLRSVTSYATVRDRGAYGHGQAAGNRVGLDRPVGQATGRNLPGKA